MLYRAKQNQDEGVKTCRIIGKGEIYGYELLNTYFVDSSGFGCDDELALTFEKFLTKVKAGYFYGIREAGQFQVYIGEYRKLSKKELQEKNPDIVSSKKIKNNTRLTIYKNGDKVLRLHNTDIIKWTSEKIILNSGGWRTATTKARLNEFLGDLGISVYQKDFEWFICSNGNELHFFDGIEI